MTPTSPPDTGKVVHLIINAMNRLQIKYGITYPRGHLEYMISRYASKIKHWRVLERIDQPRITNCTYFASLLSNLSQRDEIGHFLDYGCGVGDDVRALVNVGYPIEKLTGFDVTHIYFNLGMDLYLDHNQYNRCFTWDCQYRLSEINQFETIYSGSVIHTLDGVKEVKLYLESASQLLVQSGIIFGSTLGKKSGVNPNSSPNFLPTLDELSKLFIQTGFTNRGMYYEPTENGFVRIWFTAEKAET